MEEYPANDITVGLQEAAAKGGSGEYTLPDGTSIFHQVVAIEQPFVLKGQGVGISTLQMYGQSTPVTVYGKSCTGPAAYFLDSAGNPIGYPGSNGHPAGTHFSPFQTFNKPTGVKLTDFTYDDNIQISTDAWDGAVFLPYTGANDQAQAPVVENFEIINAYGGPHNYPDPIHVDAPGMIVENYTLTTNAIPTDHNVAGGVPGGLIGGFAATLPNCQIRNVDMDAFLELDYILSGLKINVMTAHQCLIGTQVPSGSWGGAVWNKISMSRPSNVGPVLDFSTGSGPYTDWQIKNSVFGGNINGADLFEGTWGPNNTPETL